MLKNGDNNFHVLISEKKELLPDLSLALIVNKIKCVTVLCICHAQEKIIVADRNNTTTPRQ